MTTWVPFHEVRIGPKDLEPLDLTCAVRRGEASRRLGGEFPFFLEWLKKDQLADLAGSDGVVGSSTLHVLGDLADDQASG